MPSATSTTAATEEFTPNAGYAYSNTVCCSRCAKDGQWTAMGKADRKRGLCMPCRGLPFDEVQRMRKRRGIRQG
jgi:hypothetical protein